MNWDTLDRTRGSRKKKCSLDSGYRLGLSRWDRPRTGVLDMGLIWSIMLSLMWEEL